MDALVKPVRESAEISRLRDKKGQMPAAIFGLTRCVEPIVMQALRDDQLFTLVVTYDRARITDSLIETYISTQQRMLCSTMLIFMVI